MTTTETTAPAMTEELAQRIEAAGFAKLAATGMTDPILAQKLRVTKEELRAYRAHRGIKVDAKARREWMIRQLRGMSTEASYYKSTSGQVARKIGTTPPTLNSILSMPGIPAPRKARREIIVDLHRSGHSRSTIVNVFGCSDQLVKTLSR